MTFLDDKEDSIYMEGDILITDPCYIAKLEDDFTTGSFYRKNFDNRCLAKSTIYGDWTCGLFKHDFDDIDDLKSYMKEYIDTEQNIIGANNIGEFCADAGLCGVFYLDDVLKYNPDFDMHIEKPWCAAIIKNFKGTVHYVTIDKLIKDKLKTDKYPFRKYAFLIGIGENAFFSLQI